jgi:hypothetical protein
MQAARLADELHRIAEEARAARERLRELIRQAAELRARLGEYAAQGPSGEGPSARKLEAVQ